MASPPPRCPRCNSKRINLRVDGGKLCRRCGQRWKGSQLIQSADKREIKGKERVSSQYSFPSLQ